MEEVLLENLEYRQPYARVLAAAPRRAAVVSCRVAFEDYLHHIPSQYEL